MAQGRNAALDFVGETSERGDSDREAADIILRLGPIADQLGSRGTVAQFEADIGDPARIRAGSGFAGTTGPFPRFMPMRDIVRISINIIDNLPTADLFGRLARNTRLPTDDHLVNTMPYAPTLRDAQELCVRYGDVTLPWFRRRFAISGDELRLVYQPVTSLGRIEPISTELSLMTHHRNAETFMGNAVADVRLNFAMQPPTDPVVLAERCGSCVTVGGSESYIAVPLAWWERSNPYHDPAMWREGLARCEADLNVLREPPLVGRVRAHVAAGLDARRIVTITETAHSLDVSARSLVRALSELGTTHHTIVDRVRRGRAQELLAQPEFSLADIAERLGFSDQSSFGRKCHDWFDASPARFRKQLSTEARATF